MYVTLCVEHFFPGGGGSTPCKFCQGAKFVHILWAKTFYFTIEITQQHLPISGEVQLHKVVITLIFYCSDKFTSVDFNMTAWVISITFR